MNTKVYQACYTRVGYLSIKDVKSDFPISEGYQNIHCSADIPAAAKNAFDKRRNTVLSTGATFIKYSGLSFFCDNNVWGIESLRFDLQTEDRSGGGARPCVFDQTFLMEDAYEQLKNPENLIYVSEDNFGTNIDKASTEEKEMFRKEIEGSLRWCIRNTASIPDELIKKNILDTDLSVHAICCKYGIAEENYHIFIKSVYQRLFSTENKTSIFVKTDGSLDMMMDLMYLFYSVIPYSVRVKISAGELCYEDQKGNDILFTDYVPERQIFIDPITGNENVFNDVTRARFDERYPFITYALSLDTHQRNAYFENLEEYLKNLGFGRMNNWQRQHLLLAHMLLTEEEIPENVSSVLYGLIKYPLTHNEFWESCLIKTMNVVIKNNIKLSEEMEKQLLDITLEKTKGAYLESLMDYQVRNLENLELEKGINALEEIYENKDKFSQISQKLSISEKGQELLRGLYLRIISVSKREEAENEELITLAESVRSTKGNEDLLKDIAEIALQRACKQLDTNGRTFEEIRSNLVNTTNALYGDYDGQRYDSDIELKNRYHDLLMSNICEKSIMSGDFKQFYKLYGKEYPDGAAFLRARNGVENKDFDSLEKYLQIQIPEKYKAHLCKYFASLMKKVENKNDCYVPLRIWRLLAEGANLIPAIIMIDNNAKLLFDDEVLDHDLDSEDNMWSNRIILQTIDIIKKRTKDNPRLRKQLKNSLDILKIELQLRKKNKKSRFFSLFGK